MKLPFDRAASATRAEVLRGDTVPDALSIVTDTRALRSGDTFLALRGERFDGHGFIAEALEKGAAAIIIGERGARPDDVTALLVRDTKRAFMDLAKAARQSYSGNLIAITGSNGKTTTKSFLTQLLDAQYGKPAVLSSPANENNEIGVSKLLLSIEPSHRYVVAEMGARHAGEIAELAEIAQPQIGILTNIGEAHLEIFGSREALAQTKWGLFATGAQAVLNAHDRESRARSGGLSNTPSWFGTGDPEMNGVWVVDEKTLAIKNESGTKTYPADLQFPGEYNRSNFAAAAAAALLCGMKAEAIAREAPRLRLPEGRYEIIAIPGRPKIVYDAYNASATGMIATLQAFANEKAARRIAVLGSMAELGPDAPQLHEQVGRVAATSNVDVLLTGGDFGESLRRGAQDGGLNESSIFAFASNSEAADWLKRNAKEQDIVLLKGSRKYKMEEIVHALRSGV